MDNTSFIGTPLEQIVQIQVRNIKKVELYPDYKYPAAYDDIAVVELIKPVTLNKIVWPICIPGTSYPDPDHLRRTGALMVGYGPAKDGSDSVNQLRHKIRPQAGCKSRYDPDNAEQILRQVIIATLPEKFGKGLICAGDRFSRRYGTCGGDSGAPLLHDIVEDYDTEVVTYELLGVLHGG